MRTIFIHFRRSIKLIIILATALVLIVGLMYLIFKPVYAVKLNGEIIGYTDAKKQLEEKIDSFMKKGDGNKIAFVEIDIMPEYEICYSKNDIRCFRRINCRQSRCRLICRTATSSSSNQN